MADVMSHGGDAGGDLPQRPGKRVPEECQSSQPTKRRSVSRGLNLHKLWLARKKERFPISFDIADLGTWQPVGEFQGLFTRTVGNKIREVVLPCYTDWASVPEEDRTKVLERVQTYFDMRGSLNNADYDKCLHAFARLCADRFRGYKTNAHAYYKKQQKNTRLSRAFQDLAPENWQRCVDLFTSPQFIARSKKNTENRAKQKYPSLQGSKSLVAHRYDMERAENQDEYECDGDPGLIASFHDFHTNRITGEWVNEVAQADYDRMLNEREAQMARVASTGELLDERAVVREVLGARRGHERGVGRILKGARTYSVHNMAESSSAANEMAQQIPTDAPDAKSYAVMQAKLLKLEKLVGKLATNAGLLEDDDGMGSDTEDRDGAEDLGGSS